MTPARLELSKQSGARRRFDASGEVLEWSIRHDWKSCRR